MSKTITLESYAKATRGFIDALTPLHNHIHTVYLFGSYARGEAVPGYSDLDFWIFFKPILWQEESLYIKMLATLEIATAQMQQFGIPLYNFCGFDSVANLHQLPPMLASNLLNQANSQLLFGEDVRDQIVETAVGNHTSTFFEMRRQLYLPLLPLLEQESLSKKERFMVFQALQYVKYLPEAVCASLHIFPGEAAAQSTLKSRWPAVDLSPIFDIKQFCVEEGHTAPTGYLL